MAAVALGLLGLCSRQPSLRTRPVGSESIRSGVPDTQLEPVDWTDLDGWATDDHAAAFTAFLTSCRPFLGIAGRATDAGRSSTRSGRCAAAPRPRKPRLRPAEARAFFEQNFQPVRIAKLGEATGFCTGYYEPIVEGSRFPNPEFSAPIYRRPRDL